jgi:hypothetical protein
MVLDFYDKHVFPGQGYAFVAPNVYMGFILVTNLLALKFGDRYHFYKIWTTGCSFQVFGLVLVALPVKSTMALNLVGTGFIGVGSALQQSSLNSLSASLPGYATGAQFLGQGVSGVLTALFTPLPPSSTLSLIAFLISMILTLATIPVYKLKVRGNDLVSQVNSERAERRAARLDGSPIPLHLETRDFAAIFKDTLPMAAVVMTVFATSLCLFPGVISTWQPQKDPVLLGETLVPVLIGCFQVFDVVGRTCASLPLLQPEKGRLKTTAFLAILRLAFVPLFVLIQRQPTSVGDPGDLTKLAYMALMALSNGYVGALAMMYGPTQVRRKSEQEMAGYIMISFLVLGLFSGTMLARVTQLGVHE